MRQTVCSWPTNFQGIIICLSYLILLHGLCQKKKTQRKVERRNDQMYFLLEVNVVINACKWQSGCLQCPRTGFWWCCHLQRFTKVENRKKKSKEVQSLSLQASLAFSHLLPSKSEPVFSIIAGRRGLLCSLLSFFLPGETWQSRAFKYYRRNLLFNTQFTKVKTKAKK